jgi:hypothetical protein
VITLRHNTGARLAIAAAALVVLLAAVAFSKRRTEGVAGSEPVVVETATPVASHVD